MHLLMPSSLSLSVYPLCFLSLLRFPLFSTISNWLLSALPLNNERYSFVPRSVSSSAMRAINAFFHFFLAIFYTCLSFPFVFPFLCLCLFFLSCFALFACLALLIWISCVRNSHTHTPLTNTWTHTWHAYGTAQTFAVQLLAKHQSRKTVKVHSINAKRESGKRAAR